MYLLGDVHGNLSYIINHIGFLKLKDQIFIQVGDFGIGFHDKEHEKERLETLNKFLEHTSNHLYVIRGNHDNPSYFQGDHMYSNLKLLKDYTVLDIEDHKILFVGGAISIDRSGRIKGKSYWPDEKFIYDSKKIKKIEGCDIVITHSCPNEFFPMGCDAPIVNGWHWRELDDWGTDLKKDLIKERELHSKMWLELRNKNNIKLWAYGHFHTYNNILLDDMRIKLMDINEFWEY